MEQQTNIINTSFGLQQLSGNETLYKRLLLRFHDEYQHSERKLSEIQQLNNLEAMQLLVHTIKGVSGNLGLDLLHLAAKSKDQEIKRATDCNVDLAPFIAALNTTLEAVVSYCDDGSNQALSNTAGDEVITALRQQRFVSDEKLHAFLAASDLSEQQKQAIVTAVDDLDYATAVEIIDQA
ncbi:Hpt domain-containing protein [Alteromonas sp. ASW11-36]|uniref:Hpt domain-containing protein n=1 Tax=Alteromonas arenosi TaxID=3055817 RepID=A0ABT7SWW4_9ALTE|nr:Hpt domain-containing protein [Alteromonas sp. ASW11-36]MDM7860042.1 Hpt domain-containing protein [Alteromonas sp. ASW11-36]